MRKTTLADWLHILRRKKHKGARISDIAAKEVTNKEGQSTKDFAYWNAAKTCRTSPPRWILFKGNPKATYNGLKDIQHAASGFSKSQKTANAWQHRRQTDTNLGGNFFEKKRYYLQAQVSNPNLDDKISEAKKPKIFLCWHHIRPARAEVERIHIRRSSIAIKKPTNVKNSNESTWYSSHSRGGEKRGRSSFTPSRAPRNLSFTERRKCNAHNQNSWKPHPALPPEN